MSLYPVDAILEQRCVSYYSRHTSVNDVPSMHRQSFVSIHLPLFSPSSLHITTLSLNGQYYRSAGPCDAIYY